MKIIVNILKVIAGLVILLLIVALFVNRDYRVQRDIVINKPKDVVFDYIKHIRNQDNYSAWVMADPDMKKDFKGTDGTVGFVYAWDGNKQVGQGEQEITGLAEGDSIQLELRFIRPFEGIGHAFMLTTAASANETNVTWGMAGRSTYPMNFMNLFMKGMLGKDLATSLGNLKTLLEQQ